MSITNFVLQFVVLFAPLVHPPTEQVTPNLFRGPDPKIKDIYRLHDEGFKTIISVRTNRQRKKQELCKTLGMKWINIPTGVFQTPTFEQFDQFRKIVNDPQSQPTYTACEVGMDRVGVYIAAYHLVDQKWSTEDMEKEFKEHHQKTWWPIFRKYKRVVKSYAASRQSLSSESNVSTPATVHAESYEQTF